MDTANIMMEMLKMSTGIETPDDYTVVFHMAKPKIDAESTLGTQKFVVQNIEV